MPQMVVVWGYKRRHHLSFSFSRANFRGSTLRHTPRLSNVPCSLGTTTLSLCFHPKTAMLSGFTGVVDVWRASAQTHTIMDIPTFRSTTTTCKARAATHGVHNISNHENIPLTRRLSLPLSRHAPKMPTCRDGDAKRWSPCSATPSWRHPSARQESPL